MPWAAPKPCAAPGCRALARAGARCPDHTKAHAKGIEARRGSSTARGYDYAWQRYTKAFLKRNPLCVMYCKDNKRVTASTCVDHIVAHKGDKQLFWDPNNHQAGCKSCNSRKAALLEGRWG